MKRMQRCEWCGEELGVYDDWGEVQSCEKKECNREIRAMMDEQASKEREEMRYW